MPSALYRYQMPLHQPIELGNGQLQIREGLWLNHQGRWAEAAPLPGFSHETLDEVIVAAIEWLARPTAEVSDLPSLAFAQSCLSQPSSPMLANNPVDVPLLQGSHHDILLRWQGLNNHPKQAKLKIARASPNAEALLLQQLTTLAPNCRFQLDANQQWSAAQAHSFLQQAPIAAIDFIEEPCHDIYDSIALCQEFGLRLALDEHLQQHQPADLPYHPSIQVLVIKPTLIGAFERIQQWQIWGQGAAIRLSSCYESPLGLAYLAQWAERFAQPAGLDTLRYCNSEQLSKHLLWKSN